MGGRGRIVILHGNGNPNNNNNNRANQGGGAANPNPFDNAFGDPQPPGFPVPHPHRLWNFLDDDELLDNRHLAPNNLDDDLDDIDDDDDLEMEFML